MVHAAVIWVLVQVLRIIDTPTAPIKTFTGTEDALLNPSTPVGLLFVFILVVVLLVSSHFTYKWIEAPFRRKSRELADKIGWMQTGIDQGSK